MLLKTQAGKVTVAEKNVERVAVCQLCGAGGLQPVWSFGVTPLANAYLHPEEVGRAELLVPLEVCRCPECKLVQLTMIVSPKILFDHYLYVSSTSESFRTHFKSYAEALIKKFDLTQNSLVVDVGSNDGILLKPLQERGVKVLGVDPAQNVAKMAEAQGLPTWAEYFVPEVAERIAQEWGRANVITANNVFAHTPAITQFAQAIKLLLAEDGVFVFEVQYLGDLINNNLFDIVYHEHLFYYHLYPLVKFLKRFGLEVFDVERVPVHGGSMRIFVQHEGGPHVTEARVAQWLKQEEKVGLNDAQVHEDFSTRIQRNKEQLRRLLLELKNKKKRVVGYGAPAKATTFLYTFSIGAADLDYIVDDDKKIKQGMVMPGSHIPIVSPDRLYEDKPDYCLILAWNFASGIMNKHQAFKEQGGKFIVPVPEPTIV